MNRKTVNYEDLNARQKESYNAAKLSARLADLGYTCTRLHDDYLTGDFLAVNDDHVLKVQLKSRLTIAKKYLGRGLYIAFPIRTLNQTDWYMLKHDQLVKVVEKNTRYMSSPSWHRGDYSNDRPSKVLVSKLRRYKL